MKLTHNFYFPQQLHTWKT